MKTINVLLVAFCLFYVVYTQLLIVVWNAFNFVMTILVVLPTWMFRDNPTLDMHDCYESKEEPLITREDVRMLIAKAWQIKFWRRKNGMDSGR